MTVWGGCLWKDVWNALGNPPQLMGATPITPSKINEIMQNCASPSIPVKVYITGTTNINAGNFLNTLFPTVDGLVEKNKTVTVSQIVNAANQNRMSTEGFGSNNNNMWIYLCSLIFFAVIVYLIINQRNKNK